MFIILPIIFFINSLGAQTCSTPNGINLSDSEKPYASIYPRDQGALGTCYAHSGTDLLRSYLGITVPVNILDAAINADVDVNGGYPEDVIKELVNRGYACGNSYLFRNLFPSKNTHILSELVAITVTMPVFYSVNIYTPEGKARQDRIAEKASIIAKNPTDCATCVVVEMQEKTINEIYTKLVVLTNTNVKLLNEKNKLDWHWLNRLLGDRNNEQINADIIRNRNQIEVLYKKLTQTQKSKEDQLYHFNKNKHSLDEVTEDEAAQTVYYWAKAHYQDFVKVFEKYGADKKMIPTLPEFIKERVEYDPVHKFTYAGAMYPYKLMKKIMAKSCKNNKINIPNNIRTKHYYLPSERQLGQDKIKFLLEKDSPQGVSINLHAKLLQKGSFNKSDTDDLHAVNIIGCRTVGGKLQYLIHNSWGSSCINYAPQFDCVEGRAWINAQSVLSASSEVLWLER